MSGCIALVVAAGRGRRFGGDLPKQYRLLGGQPVLRRALAAFINHPEVDAVRPVIHPDDEALLQRAAEGLNLLAPVHGGVTRQDSVRRGLESLAEQAPERVLIHDGARPFVDPDVISRTIAALETAVGAVPAVPVRDTLKRGSGGRVAGTVARQDLWRAQTPQGFRFADILAAHRRFAGEGLTDDATLAEQAELSVALVAGSEDNLKVTTEDDLDRAERLLGSDVRTGMGLDVHRFGPGDHLMLCGVRVPFDRGLRGHSDADVGLHAATDSVLGALGAGDIGSHFPADDPQWRNADSEIFLRRAAELAAAGGAVITGIDITLICERPKIAPHREAMARRVAEILALPVGRVSVKGTTTEGLGFTGRGEGIAAQAVATVRFASQR